MNFKKIFLSKKFKWKIFLIFSIAIYIISISFYYIPIFQKFELKILDLKYKSRPQIKIHPDIAYIDFDDTSIELVGQWVWPRSRQIILVKTLDYYKTKAAGYDIFFAEKGKIILDLKKMKSFLSNINQELKKINPSDIKKIQSIISEAINVSFKDYDAEFAESIRDANNIYLGSYMIPPSEEYAKKGVTGVKIETELNKKNFSDDKKKTIEFLSKFTVSPDKSVAKSLYKSVDIVLPLLNFSKAAKGVGFAQIIKDMDANVRLFPISIYYDEKVWFALSFILNCDLLNVNIQNIKIIPNKYIEIPNVKLYGASEIKTMRIPIDEHIQMLINWAGDFENTYLHLSYRLISYYYSVLYAKNILKEFQPDINNCEMICNKIRSTLQDEELVDDKQAIDLSKNITTSYIVLNYTRLNKFNEEIKKKLLKIIDEKNLNKIILQTLFALNFEKNKNLEYTELLKISKVTNNKIFQESYKNLVWFSNNRNLKDAEPYYFPEPVSVKKNGCFISFSPVDIQNKIFMIGLTGLGTIDLNPMPFQQSTPMVAMHTNALNMFLTGQYLNFPPDAWKFIAPFIAVLVTIFFTLILQPIAALICSLITAIFIFIISFYYFWILKHTWVHSLVPILAVLISYLSVLIYHFALAQKEKKKIRGIFSTMVSPAVLKLMEENPDRFSLTGERKDATMIFSLVCGFAKIIKSSNPDELSSILSIYLTPTSEIIMDYGGYIDKYEGHIIMADFGVPLDDKGHFWKCAYSAIEQQLDIKAFQFFVAARFGIDVYTAMGINYGYVSAGNMGSEQKFQYTVMGDAVNVAARFMPANFIYNSRIITGEDTYPKIKDYVELRHLDKLLLKGKTKPTDIYEIQGWKSDVYLNLFKNKEVPSSLLTRWLKAPPEKIIGYINFWNEKYNDTNNNLCNIIHNFFFNFRNTAVEQIYLENQKEYLSYLNETGSLIIQLKNLTGKNFENGILKSNDYLENLNGWIYYLEHIEEDFKKFIEKNNSKIDTMTSSDIESRISVLINKLTLSKNKFNYKQDISEDIRQVFENLKKFIVDIKKYNLEEIKNKILKFKLNYDKEVSIFYNDKIKSNPEQYFQMMASVGTLTQQMRKVNEFYNKGINYYWSRNWDEALKSFEHSLECKPDDGPTMTLIERTKIYKINPPGENWQGEFVQTKK